MDDMTDRARRERDRILRSLSLGVDGIYAKVRLEKDKAAMLPFLAALRDGYEMALAMGRR